MTQEVKHLKYRSVYRFRLNLNIDAPEVEITIPVEYENNVPTEEDVQNKFFDKEAIERYKKEVCKVIMDSNNPFIISCYDTDMYDDYENI